MVIFDVAPGGRDNYKIWQERQVPQVIFEMTSAGTKTQDLESKKTLYEQLGVFEYWLFDPRGEWIGEQLRGYRLQGETYQIIADGRSEPLKLRLEVEGELIGFYREDTGKKLLIPDELAQALREKDAQLQREQQKLAEMEAKLKQYQERFGELPE
jgi:hypothetical protein